MKKFRTNIADCQAQSSDTDVTVTPDASASDAPVENPQLSIPFEQADSDATGSANSGIHEISIIQPATVITSQANGDDDSAITSDVTDTSDTSDGDDDSVLPYLVKRLLRYDGTSPVHGYENEASLIVNDGHGMGIQDYPMHARHDEEFLLRQNCTREEAYQDCVLAYDEIKSTGKLAYRTWHNPALFHRAYKFLNFNKEFHIYDDDNEKLARCVFDHCMSPFGDTSKTPHEYTPDKNKKLVELERYAEEHQEHVQRNAYLEMHGWDKIDAHQYIDYVFSDRVQARDSQNDGLGSIYSLVIRNCYGYQTKNDKQPHPYQMRAECMIHAGDAEIDAIQAELAQNPSVLQVYGSLSCTYLGVDRSDDNLQSVCAIDIDVDDVTSETLRQMLDTMSSDVATSLLTPDVIINSSTGMHAIYALRTRPSVHDSSTRCRHLTGAFGGGSGRAMYAGLYTIKGALQRYYDAWCGKEAGTDKLSPTQLCGIPGTPTKQCGSAELKKGHDFHGSPDAVQTYDAYMSPRATDTCHRVTLIELMENDEFMRCLYDEFKFRVDFLRIDGRKTALNTSHRAMETQVRHIGISFDSPDELRQSLFAAADRSVGLLDQSQLAGNGITIDDAIDQALMMLLGMTDPAFLLMTHHEHGFKYSDDPTPNPKTGQEMLTSRLKETGHRVTDIRSHKARINRGVRRDTASALDVDCKVWRFLSTEDGQSIMNAWDAHPYRKTCHRPWRFSHLSRSLSSVCIGHRYNAMRELLLGGRACNIDLRDILTIAYAAMCKWNERDMARGLEPVTMDDFVSAMTLSATDADALVNWRNVFSIIGLPEMYVSDDPSGREVRTYVRRTDDGLRSPVDRVLYMMGFDAPAFSWASPDEARDIAGMVDDDDMIELFVSVTGMGERGVRRRLSFVSSRASYHHDLRVMGMVRGRGFLPGMVAAGAVLSGVSFLSSRECVSLACESLFSRGADGRLSVGHASPYSDVGMSFLACLIGMADVDDVFVGVSFSRRSHRSFVRSGFGAASRVMAGLPVLGVSVANGGRWRRWARWEWFRERFGSGERSRLGSLLSGPYKSKSPGTFFSWQACSIGSRDGPVTACSTGPPP